MDKKIQCVDCSKEFNFSESEQNFYNEKGFALPKRCKDCRARRKAEKNG